MICIFTRRNDSTESKKGTLYCAQNLDLSHHFAKVEVYCFSSLSASSSPYPFSPLRPIPLHGERLIGVRYLLRPCPFFVGSLGSRSIIGFPPRETPRFNKYYVRTRYPARGVYCTRRESSLPIIPASSHGVVTVETSLYCRLSNREV